MGGLFLPACDLYYVESGLTGRRADDQGGSQGNGHVLGSYSNCRIYSSDVDSGSSRRKSSHVKDDEELQRVTESRKYGDLLQFCCSQCSGSELRKGLCQKKNCLPTR